MEEKVKGLKILGYLISLRVKSCDVSVDDFNQKLNEISNPEYSTEQIESFKMSYRKPIDAYSNAVKSVRHFDNKNDNERIYCRHASAADENSKRIIIQETFTDNNKLGERRVIGDVNIQGDVITSTKYVDTNVFDNVISHITKEYERQLKMFNSTSLRSKINAMIKDCLPIYYDAEHNFKFISSSNKNVIDLIKEVAEIVNLLDTSSKGGRESRTEVQVMPIPDLECMEDVMKVAAMDTIEEEERFIKEALADAVNGAIDSAKLYNAIERSKALIHAINEHKSLLSIDIEKFSKKIDGITKDMSVILGGQEQNSEKRHIRWKGLVKKIDPNQTVIGSMLMIIPGVELIAKSRLNHATFRDDARGIQLIQTSISNKGVDVEFTITGIDDIPNELDGLGFFKTGTGISYYDPPSEEMLQALSDWWKSVPKK